MPRMINDGGRMRPRPKGYRRDTAIAVIKMIAFIGMIITYPVWGRLIPNRAH